MKTSEKIDLIAAALVKAQRACTNPPLDAVNPHYKSRYSSLAAVREAVLPFFHAEGLAVVQAPAAHERGVALVTTLVHTSGQYVEFDPLSLPLAKNDPQGAGSAITYMRRYALLALAGVVGEDDDDGAAASDKAHPASLVKGGAGADAPAPLGRRASVHQRGAIVALAEQLQMAPEYVISLMQAQWGKSNTSQLTAGQADALLTMMREPYSRGRGRISRGTDRSNTAAPTGAP